MNSGQLEPASLRTELARADKAFACIALAQNSRATQAPLARKLIQRQETHWAAAVDDVAFDLATFEPISPDLTNVIAMVGDLKSAYVIVRGRFYPPGWHVRLFQWLSCHARMVTMQLPIAACDYTTGGLRLPCSLLGSFHAHGCASHSDPEAYLTHAAAVDGLDRCPRYIAERLLRFR